MAIYRLKFGFYWVFVCLFLFFYNHLIMMMELKVNCIDPGSLLYTVQFGSLKPEDAQSGSTRDGSATLALVMSVVLTAATGFHT